MKKFESIIEAIREVRNMANSPDSEDQIYLAVDYWGETFYVTDDGSEIDEKITRDFFENHTDVNPDRFAEEWKVIEYCHANRKEKYPFTYEKAKRTAFNSKVSLIRKRVSINTDYSVEFIIG